MFEKYENNNDALAKVCKDEIKRRLTITPIGKLAVFYLRKYSFSGERVTSVLLIGLY